MTPPNAQAPVRTVLLGCGAISELYYAPALRELARDGVVRVVGVYDPNPERVAALRRELPGAGALTGLDDLGKLQAGLAIIASPVKYHAAQSVAALRQGAHVLCEKPMAANEAEAEQMMAAAGQAGRRLAIGLYRRFLPATNTIKQLLDSQVLGPLKSFHFAEGGEFNWPAQSASLFQKSAGVGGALIDLGVHGLDLALWWFGDPQSLTYEDDAMGGVESNARVTLHYDGQFSGSAFFSRDWVAAGHYRLEAERGSILWRVGEADRLTLRLGGVEHVLDCQLQQPTAGGTMAAWNFSQSFTGQITDLLQPATAGAPPRVSGQEGLRSLRLIGQCYRQRQLMPMPWLSQAEIQGAQPWAKEAL